MFPIENKKMFTHVDFKIILKTLLQVEKFRQFLEEIEQITKLTVSLTIRQSRLAKRIESGKLRSDMVSEF